MGRQFLRPPSDAELRSRYPVRVLAAPRLEPGGIGHGPEGSRALLHWSEVRRIAVAEVGEPEGVRTIVFDLVIGAPGGVAVLRLDAEPGDDAIALARALETGLGSERASIALKSLAVDGLATHWYPDLRAFEEDALAELERG